MILASHGIIGSQILQVDADYLAFYNRVITAGGSLSTTEQDATLQLVLDLKDYGIWTKMQAIYPMVGASAAACAQNLKSSSFTGTFTSGWTFASTGVTPNGTSAYMDTGLVPNGNLSQNSVSMTYYSRTNQSFTDTFMGCADTSYANGLYFIPKNSPNNEYSRVNQSSFTNPTGHSNTFGFFEISRIASTGWKSFRNGSVVNTVSVASSGLSSANIYVGSGNFSPQQYTSCECAFASIGDGLTDTEASDFYDAVDAFQTTLSRNV